MSEKSGAGMHTVIGIIMLIAAGEEYLLIQHCLVHPAVFTVLEGGHMQFYKRLLFFLGQSEYKQRSNCNELNRIVSLRKEDRYLWTVVIVLTPSSYLPVTFQQRVYSVKSISFPPRGCRT